MLESIKIIVVVFWSALSIFTHASDVLPAQKDPVTYVGIKSGFMDISMSEMKNGIPVELKSDIPIGIQFGLSFDSGFGIEGEYIRADLGNGTTQTLSTDMSTQGATSISSASVYGVYKSPGDLYAKTKLGLLWEEIASLNEEFTIKDPGVSTGIGLGYRFSNSLSAEIEYTFVEEDVDFYSLGINYSF